MQSLEPAEPRARLRDVEVEPFSQMTTIFGVVTDGQSVVDAISRVATGSRDVPLQRVIIERIDIIQSPR